MFVGGIRNLGKYNWEVTTPPITISTKIYNNEQRTEHFVFVCVKDGGGSPAQYFGGYVLNCKLTFEF